MSIETRSLGPWQVQAPTSRLTALVALLTVVHVGAAGLVAALHVLAGGSAGGAQPPQVTTAPGGSSLATGAWLLAVLVIDVAIVLVIARLPDWTQRALRTGIVLLVAVLVGSGLQAAFAAGVVPAVVPAGVAVGALVGPLVVATLSRLDLLWLGFDAVGIMLAIAGTTLLAGVASPAAIAALLGLVIIWDVIAVRSGVMGVAARLALAWRAPVLVVVPTQIRVSFDDLVAPLAERDRDSGVLLTAIGLGDLVLPGVLVVATLSTGAAPAVFLGTIGGAVAMETLQVEGLRPAMPWLGGGALVGWAVSLVVV
jgi:presenilin-like A22 family membrane protease